MKLRLTIVVMILFVACTKEIPENGKRFTNLTGDYLGQTDPGTAAAVFGLGVVSTGMNERDAAFSPDGNEFYYSVWQNGRGVILYMKKINERWTQPKTASFSGKYSDIEPFITSDGKKLYFASNRPVEGTEPKDYDIWYVEKNESGDWGEPVVLGPEINTEANEFYPSLTDEGNLYFTAANEKSFGREDIFVSKFVDGQYQQYENLGDSVNSPKDEFNSFIAKDGSYLLYTTTGFGDGLGGGDIWICFKKDDGSWTSPKNLGENINSNKLDYCPSITQDGKYLFFTSNRVNDRKYNEAISYEQLVKEFNNPYNGAGDIYWVSSEVIDMVKGKR